LSLRTAITSAESLYFPKSEYKEGVERISLPDSPVGIDAQYTHAIIITYVQQIADGRAELVGNIRWSSP
jgi:hypothetical protein